MTDSDRFPLLTAAGRVMLKRLREHPHAPRYTAQCGNRLTADYLRRVQAFEAEVRSSPVGWPEGGFPDWLSGFVEMCFCEVPFYREYGAQPARLADIPMLNRADLAREPWAFVPDTQPLDDLILYETSGTTGHPLTVLSHPIVSNSYLPLLKIALEKIGITLTSGPGDVGCVLVGWQQRAYTYPSVTPLQGEAAHLKLNLHPDDWRDPADRVRFLDDLNPEIYTGDPLAFAELMALPLTTRPKALISTAMTLLPGLRAQLEARFGCPVLDVYSMNESGPIAVLKARMNTNEHEGELLHHRVFVEILNADSRVCSPGERGEVTLTGGFNPFLPLLRYRTNDYAALEWRSGGPVLVELEGRAPVVYRAADGRTVNNLDVTGALKPFALPQYSVHQSAGGSLYVRYRGLDSDADKIRVTLLTLFGAQQTLAVERVETLGDKVVQYTSDYSTT
ncbi:MAG: capsule biosynthesis protein CapK [Anaerolineales bacterium]